MMKRLEAEDNPKKVLEPEEDQGYASVLPAVGAREQLQKTSQKSNGPAKMVYWKLPFMLARKEVLRQVSGLDVWWTLRASIDYGCRAPIERLHGYRALTE